MKYKNPSVIPIKLWVVIAILIFGTSIILDEANAQTGSHAGATTSPLTSYWYQASDKIKSIRELLGEGRSADAVKASYAFLKMIKETRDDDNIKMYFGYNALCAAHTSNKSADDAIEACDKAISILPGRWQAYNNRGTAHYVSGYYKKAAEDYRKALTLGTDSENIQSLIRHNIDLVEEHLPRN